MCNEQIVCHHEQVLDQRAKDQHSHDHANRLERVAWQQCIGPAESPIFPSQGVFLGKDLGLNGRLRRGVEGESLAGESLFELFGFGGSKELRIELLQPRNASIAALFEPALHGVPFQGHVDDWIESTDVRAPENRDANGADRGQDNCWQMLNRIANRRPKILHRLFDAPA